MKIKRVHIENFFSIESIDYDLDSPGLHLVLGKNTDNKALDSNGSGKSSFFEAIIWCLYGKTVRDVPIDSVVRKGSEGASVWVEIGEDKQFEEAESIFVCRSRKNKKSVLDIRVGSPKGPNLFGANSVVDLQQDLDLILGADFNTFTNSVYFSKEVSKFFMISNDNDRKALLESILQLFSFEDPLTKAKEKLKSIENEIHTTKTSIEITTASLDEAEEKLHSSTFSYQNALAALLDAQERRKHASKNLDDVAKNVITLSNIKTAREMLAEKKRHLHSVPVTVPNPRVETRYASIEHIIRDRHTEIRGVLGKGLTECLDTHAAFTKAYEPKLAEAKQLIQDVDSHIFSLKSYIQKCNDKLTGRFTNLVGTTCPLCFSKVNPEHIDAVKRDTEQEIKDLQAEIKVQEGKKSYYIAQHLDPLTHQKKEADTEYSTCVTYLEGEKEKQVALFNAKLLKLNTNKTKRLSRLKEAETKNRLLEINEINEHLLKLTKEESELNALNVSLRNVVINLDQLINTNNSYVESLAGDLAKQEKAILDRKTKINDLSSKIKTLTHEREIAEFWVEAFGPKGIRSFVFEDALPYLTRRANYYSMFLTGGTVTINISPMTTTKSTGIDKEKIFVSAKNSLGADLYTGCSSGEKTRIDLCILLGIQDLIATRITKTWATAFYDEILDTLDNTGIDVVVDLFRKLTDHKSTFIISHNSHLKSYFDNAIVLVKKDGKTSIEGE